MTDFLTTQDTDPATLDKNVKLAVIIMPGGANAGIVGLIDSAGAEIVPATQATLAALLAKLPAQGQALAAASLPVVLPAAQITTLTPPAAITGFATETTLAALNTKVTAVNTGAVVVSSSALPTGAATEATLDARTGSLTETAPATDTASSGLNGRLQRIAQRLTSLIASTLTVQQARSATATLTNVNASATNVAVLASNASRLQAMLFNDSTALLYLNFGATASSTAHTVQIPANSYYELPTPVYTGALNGIWTSATGAVRVTELTA